ncbi:MAG: S9 family peptidase [Crocinitomicaceae bacterium]|nr:S9 family peptidase [Crocinitomicaceae bacterium]
MKNWIIIIPLVLLSSCRWVKTKEEQKSKELQEMNAPNIEQENFIHADKFSSRIDYFNWMMLDPQEMKDSTASNVKRIYQHILAENEYTDAKFYVLQDLKSELTEEFNSFQSMDGENSQFVQGEFKYYFEYTSESSYPEIYRSSAENEGQKELIFDFNKIGVDFNYFQIGEVLISPNNQYIAYSADTTGSQKFFISIYDISKNLTQKTSIKKCDGQIIWGSDSRSIYFIESTKNNGKRTSSVYQYHFLESGINKEKLIDTQLQEGFWTIERSKSGRFIFIYLHNNNTVTTFFIDLQRNQKPVLFKEPEKGVRYILGHQKEHFIIKTNQNSSDNFRLFKSKISDFQRSDKWEVLVGHREDVVIEKMDIFEKFIVLEEKVDGLEKFHILNSENGLGHYAEFQEETYSARLVNNNDYYAEYFTYQYSSLSTPPSIFLYEFESRKNNLIQRSEPNSDFDEDDFKTERIWATSFDGTKIPVSLIYKKNVSLDGKAPIFIEYEGSYGNTKELSFKPERFSLLERGFVCAIAHLRGGGYLGEKWHSEGMKLRKVRSVMDLEYSIRHLINNEYGSAEKVFISANGANALIAGTLVNNHPEMIRGAIFKNPGFDLLTRLLNEENINRNEIEEWGNPEIEEQYFYIKSYSPYENIHSAYFPSIFIQCDLNSTKTKFWESLKWVARVREKMTSSNKILVHTNLNKKASSQDKTVALEKKAEQFAFLISLLD